MSRSKLFAALRAGALLALPLTLPGTGSGSPGTGAGGAPGTGTTEAPTVSATMEQCVTAATQAGRSVTFTGEMETVPGAHRMAMRVVVEEHALGEAGFHPLTAGGLGAWERSEVGLKIYKYVRQVTDLPAPAAFRAIVQYRWLNEKGRAIKREERRTSICREPGEPPAAQNGAPQNGAPATMR